MALMVTHSRRRLISMRALAIVWLAFAATMIVGLAGEAWLRYERHQAYLASERFRKTNVFFANGMELNGGNHSLWLRRWKEYQPGARAEVEAGGVRFVIQMNSRGFRTHEFQVPKPQGMVRVICIGGSTTVAGRTNEETYPALLEASLRERFPGLPIEVLNFGISSVTTEYWYERLGEVLSYEPDVLVQYQAINDISWRHLPRYAESHGARGLAYKSLLVQRLFPFPTETLEPYLQETFESMAATSRAARERGVAYLAASFAGPDPDGERDVFRRHLDYNAEYWMRKFPMHSYRTWSSIVATHNRLFVDFAEGHHVPYVLVHEQLYDPTLFTDVCHFTPEGIALLADTFLPALEDQVRDTEEYRLWAQTGPGAR
jgi:lysophospholipase L1-like esterase